MAQDTKEQKEEVEDPVAAIRENLGTAKELLTKEDQEEGALIYDLKVEVDGDNSDTSDADSGNLSDTTSISIDPNTVPTTTPTPSDDPQSSDSGQISEDSDIPE